MLTQRKTAFLREGIDITQLPWTMDSAYVSQERRERRPQLGFLDIIIAGKGNDVLTIDGQKWEASTWKNVLMLAEPTWGIDVPSCRIWGSSPTLGRPKTGKKARFSYPECGPPHHGPVLVSVPIRFRGAWPPELSYPGQPDAMRVQRPG